MDVRAQLRAEVKVAMTTVGLFDPSPLLVLAVLQYRANLTEEEMDAQSDLVTSTRKKWRALYNLRINIGSSPVVDMAAKAAFLDYVIEYKLRNVCSIDH
jgi:hypothetical protein